MGVSLSTDESHPLLNECNVTDVHDVLHTAYTHIKEKHVSTQRRHGSGVWMLRDVNQIHPVYMTVAHLIVSCIDDDTLCTLASDTNVIVCVHTDTLHWKAFPHC